jgi:excisionase family DNA binding protein
MDDRSPIARVWLNVDEASQRTGVSKTELYEVIKKGELKAYRRKENAKWRIHIDDVDAWMRAPQLRSAS